MNPAASRLAFASVLFPPRLLGSGREIEVRVMRPERPAGTSADGSPRWTRPQLDRREWFSSAEALTGWRAPSNRHVWVAGAVRTRRDGTKAGVAASASLWVDIDDGGEAALQDALKELARRDLLPTIVVQSSPGKHHLWWSLEEPLQLAEVEAKRAFEGVLAALAELLGGDRACIDCSRVLRLPGTLNVKPWYDPAPPVEVLEAHPERVYPFVRFLDLVPARPGPRARDRAEAPQPPRESGPPAPDAADLPSHAALPYLHFCAFVQHAWGSAATLPEPLWSALAWTLASTGEAGEAVFHALSRPHPRFDPTEASARIQYARERSYKPPSCRSLSEHGFTCPRMDPQSGCCTQAPVRTPAALIKQGPAAPGTGFIRDGRTWRVNAEVPPTPIADFTVRFTEEFILPEGSKRLTLEAVALDGTVYPLHVPAESLADAKDLLCRIAGAMGFAYRGMDPRSLPVARSAWQDTSEIRRIRVHRDFGFATDGRSFVGLDLGAQPDLRFEVPTASAALLGLRSLPDRDVDATIALLLDRWPRVACGEVAAQLMLAVAVWALVAPVLEGRGAEVAPLCAWVTGASGLGKSTSTATIQCLFGDFADRGRLLSFGSTPYSIEDGAHDFRGALLVIDDAKESTINAGQRASLLGVLQRMPDRTARARLRHDGSQQPARGSRTTALVNGEDVLFQEASIRARYFAIPAAEAIEQNQGALGVHNQIRRTASGVTAALVRMLLDQPCWFDETYRAYVAERSRIEGQLPRGDNRPRVSASAAAILAGWRLFIDLAQARGLLSAEDALRRVDGLRGVVTGLASDQVFRTASLTPGERFLAELRQLMAADFVRIDGITSPRGQGLRIGFAREGWIGVFPELAVVRCNEVLHKDGDRLPSAETVGASLDAIGALAGRGKDRVASRKSDPQTRQKQSVWLIKSERLVEEGTHEGM